MCKKDFFYCKDVIRFSLKNATKPISTIRLRVNLHGERLTFYLPVEYKIQPKHWDKEMGCAIEDSKRNPDLKGNIRLQLILRNINKEIEKTTNALIKVLEEMKLHEIYPTVDAVRTKLREELNQATKGKRMFADFISFMEYYISLCKDYTEQQRGKTGSRYNTELCFNSENRKAVLRQQTDKVEIGRCNRELLQ